MKISLCEQTLVSWVGDTLVCTQNGEKDKRGWKHWIEGDKLHLVSEAYHIIIIPVYSFS